MLIGIHKGLSIKPSTVPFLVGEPKQELVGSASVMFNQLCACPQDPKPEVLAINLLGPTWR